jgi:hypothetical protein
MEDDDNEEPDLYAIYDFNDNDLDNGAIMITRTNSKPLISSRRATL